MNRTIPANDEMAGTAFEFVTGTLRGQERELFKSRMQHDNTLKRETHYWEEHFMVLQEAQQHQARAPLPQTWQAIEQQLFPQSDVTDLMRTPPKKGTANNVASRGIASTT